VKRLISLGLILVLLLTACGNRGSEAEETVSEPATEVAQATPTEPGEPEATPTEAPSTATPTQAAAPEANTAEEEPTVQAGQTACRLESIQELLPLEPLPGIDPVTATDWQHGGGQDARVQIIEYGDFQ
jgi:hypothetical protein